MKHPDQMELLYNIRLCSIGIVILKEHFLIIVTDLCVMAHFCVQSNYDKVL